MTTIGTDVPPIEDQLRRNDKWFLGGGRKALWAPEWPLWLDEPGFWDHACFYDIRVEPIFTVTFLNEDGQAMDLDFVNRTWVPSHLTQAYSAEGLEITERRALLPDDVLVSDLLLSNPGTEERRLHLVMWTCQRRSGGEQGQEIDRCERFGGGILLHHRRYTDSKELNYEYALAYRGSMDPTSYSIHLSEGGPNQPRWELTPFYETFNGSLDNEEKFDVGVSQGGLFYVAQHYDLTLPPGESLDLTLTCALAESDEEARINAETAASSTDPIQISADNWEAWFRSVPEFRCDDLYLETYYWYRWYGLKLNRIFAATERLPYPCVYEGINHGWFRHAISYSAQVHMLECKWMHSSELAMGSLRNFIAHQLEDGSFPGAILTGQAEAPRGFYHANWGKCIRELYAHHRDRGFLEEAYSSLARYARYFQNARDPERSHLFDVVDQAETGQEYMARYLCARPDADDWGPIRLKGVDATVYLYELFRCLEWMAGKTDREADAPEWKQAADATLQAVRERMWDDSRHFFVDVKPESLESCPSQAAVGFYPFLTDLAESEHLKAITEHLFKPEEFWTSWPVPSTSADDPTFSATGEWKGKRMVCPWNGRTWLMTNSHVADALAQAAQRLDRSLEGQAVELFQRFIQMMFLDRDPKRPTSYEYYNPLTAKAPFFRGTEDYMHSYIADLILKYVAGVQIEEDRLVVDPLPFPLERFSADHIPAGGHWVRVTYSTTDGMRVYVDGHEVSATPDRRRVEVPLR